MKIKTQIAFHFIRKYFRHFNLLLIFKKKIVCDSSKFERNLKAFKMPNRKLFILDALKANIE